VEEQINLSFFKGGGRMTGMLHEECGVLGIFEPKRANIADSVYLGLLYRQIPRRCLRRRNKK